MNTTASTLTIAERKALMALLKKLGRDAETKLGETGRRRRK